MANIIHKKKTNLAQIGNSKGIRYPKTYREAAGMKENGQEIEIAVINTKYGIALVQYLPGEQPEMKDLEENITRKLMEEE